MSNSVLPLGTKPPDYFQHPRPELVERLPRPLGQVLDLGCGAGQVGRTLRAAGAEWLVGVELDSEAAARARSVFDEVLVGDVEQVLTGLDRRFDTICAYDILEHLYDPGAVLERLRAMVASAGHLQVSLPNARYYSLFRDLVFRGTFGYELSGHRDVTHVRWFTRRDIEQLLRECGWRVLDVSTHALRPSKALLARVTGGYSTEYLTAQWFVLCRPD